MSAEHNKQEPETTGHQWDGIEEYNNPLPKWWLWMFYATIVWGIGYTIAYPAWPLIRSATPGLIGYSTRAQVAEDIDAVNAQNADLVAELETTDLATLVGERDSGLYRFAANGGRAIFAANCSQCHGSGANGVEDGNGYPNLRDDDWLWGGSIEDIAYTITNGIRNEQSLDARFSQMPAFGDILSEEEINNVVNYVLSISGQDYEQAEAELGSAIFADNCTACHGEDGTGDRMQGAPNLTDAVWLYGSDPASIAETVKNARFGVMPAWSDDYNPIGLTQSEINSVAVYVHQLGGGE